MRRVTLALVVVLALPLAPGIRAGSLRGSMGHVEAAPRGTEQKPDPKSAPTYPSYVQRVLPAVVGVKVQVPANRPSVLTLGPERWGSGVIFDPAGYALTVSYILLDAGSIEVFLRDGRTVPGKLVGLDLETGLGVLKLEAPGPWPAAAVADSSGVTVGQATAIVGVDGDNDLVVTQGTVQEIRRFAGYWEYMLDRAFVVVPGNPAFGGSPLVNLQGEVIGITSLRLGERPFINLAIPVEKFLAWKDELLRHGRVVSRKPRPWLGLYTLPGEGGGVVVAGVSPFGPAAPAGFQRGDVIVRLNGEQVGSQEEFYTRLWATEIGQEVTLVVRRGSRFEAITVRPADRYQVFRTTEK